jgi:general secretion pathway protein G
MRKMQLLRIAKTNRQIASRMARRGGFTLVEILIVVVILGILATIVIPQFSNASIVARENALKDDLRYIRTQLQVFRAQHLDVSPGYPGGVTTAAPTEAAFLDQMTHYSDQNGNTSATQSVVYKFGPYLGRIPENPVNGVATIKMIPNGTAMPAPQASEANQYGWIYKPSTQEIIANLTGNDSTGQTPYAKY